MAVGAWNNQGLRRSLTSWVSLVETTAAKLQAYRRVIEQFGEYWTVERLELRQWDFLYEQAQK